MIRLLDINGHQVVAGLAWDSLAGSTTKGIDAKERVIDFDGVAYLKGPDPSSKKKRPPVRLLAGGYATSEKMLESSDAIDQDDILKKPSLFLWVISELEKQGIGLDEDGKVNGVVKLDLGNGETWLGAIRRSRPTAFDDSDWVGTGDAVNAALTGLVSDAESLIDDIEVYELSAEDLLIAKPARSVGVIVKGRGGAAATAFQLLIVAGLLGGIGFFVYETFLAQEETVSAAGPTPEQQRMRALSSYERAMQSDFGYASTLEAYEAVTANGEGVPTQVEEWELKAISCSASSSECIYQYQSPGFGSPSAIEDVFGIPLEINLTGREALYRSPIDFKKRIDRSFRVPASENVRKALLDAGAFLRSPAIELAVDITAPETVDIDNGSFLSRENLSEAYQKGAISVGGPLGLFDVAATELDIEGVVVTEVVINQDEFAMRGHYAFE